MSVSKAAKDIVQLLQPNNLLQLALRVANQALALCAQHATANASVTAATESFAKIGPRAAAMIEELSRALLSKATGAPQVQIGLALAHAADVGLTGFAALQAAVAGSKKQWRRLRALAGLGLGCAVIWQERSFAMDCQKLMRNTEWWARCADINVPFEQRLWEQDPTTYIPTLFPNLLAASALDFDLLTQLCADYKISTDLALRAFVLTALQQPPSSYLQVRLFAACRRAQDQAGLAQFLFTDCLFSVDSCDYERLRVVLQLLVGLPAPADQATVLLGRNGLLVLDVLQSYQTQSPAIPISGANPNVVATDDARQRRLPFHPLIRGAPLEVLGREVSVASVSALLPMAAILGVPGDDLCALAVERLLAGPAQHISLAAIAPVLPLFASRDSAIMVAKMVADKAVDSCDRVAALAAAVELATASCAAVVEDSAEASKSLLMLERLQAAHGQAATEHALHMAGVHAPELLSLVSAPSDLILRLCHEFAATGCFQGGAGGLVALTDSIATRHGLSGIKLRSRFVLGLLTADVVTEAGAGGRPGQGLSLSSLLDDDTGTTALAAVQCAWEWDTRLQAAAAVLRVENVSVVVPNLARCVSGDLLPPEQQRTRLRAALALVSVVGPTAAAEALSTSPVGLRDHILALCYICRFQELVLQQQSVNDFLSSNKEGLIRGLWRSHSHRASVVRLACELSLDYGLQDGNLWGNMLQQLAVNNEIDFLTHMLPVLSKRPEVFVLPTLPRIWASTAVGLAGRPVSNRLLVEFLFLMPFIASNSRDLISELMGRKQQAAAALCATIAGSFESVADTCGVDVLLDSCISAGTFGGEKLRFTVFSHLERTGAARLWDSLHLPDYVLWAVRRGRASDVLRGLVDGGRAAQAARLAAAVLEALGDSSPLSGASGSELVAEVQRLEAGLV